MKGITSLSLCVLLFLFLWFSCASKSSSKAAKGFPVKVQSSNYPIQRCETQNLRFLNLSSGTPLIIFLWISLKLNLLVSLPIILCHKMIYFSFTVVHILYPCLTTHIHKPTYMYIISLKIPSTKGAKKKITRLETYDQVFIIIK